MSATPNLAQSPCVRNCCLDDNCICIGCFRSLQEIKEWGVIDNDRRLVILENARQRKKTYQRRPPSWTRIP